MKKLILTAVLLLLPGLAAAAPLASTDGNANYGCEWVQGENTNALVLKGDCAGIPTVTSGYKYTTETKIVERLVEGECGPEVVRVEVTERVEREARGGAEIGRAVVERTILD